MPDPATRLHRAQTIVMFDGFGDRRDIEIVALEQFRVSAPERSFSGACHKEDRILTCSCMGQLLPSQGGTLLYAGLSNGKILVWNNVMLSKVQPVDRLCRQAREGQVTAVNCTSWPHCSKVTLTCFKS